MMQAGFAGSATALSLLAALVAPSALAQSYAGCFVNGQRVADSMCQGGGGGGSAPSMTSNPMFGGLMSMSRTLGGAMVKSLMSPPQQLAPSSQPPRSSSQALPANQSAADPGVVAARLSRQAADADARSLADSLTRQMQQRQAAEAGIVEPGEVLKDSLISNQSPSTPQGKPKPQGPMKPAQIKHTFPKTAKECQAEFDLATKTCAKLKWQTDQAICEDDQLKWLDACHAQLSAEGWR